MHVGIYIYMCVYMHIYGYIDREREDSSLRERYVEASNLMRGPFPVTYEFAGGYMLERQGSQLSGLKSS